MSGPVAQTGKKPQPNRTTTGNNRTFGCGWGPAQQRAVAVAAITSRSPTGCDRLQPVATVFAWLFLWYSKGTRLSSPAAGVIGDHDAVGVAFGADASGLALSAALCWRDSAGCNNNAATHPMEPQGLKLKLQAVCTTDRPQSGCVTRASNDDNNDNNDARQQPWQQHRFNDDGGHVQLDNVQLDNGDSEVEDQATNDDDDDDDASHTDDATYDPVGNLGTRRQRGAVTLLVTLRRSDGMTRILARVPCRRRRGHAGWNRFQPPTTGRTTDDDRSVTVRLSVVLRR
ncbi:hypothetical protein EDB84DRAFT_1440275 [Lactarius hengduanensis]|nr:hypothetical protein EDB84DRAFT_1440275 [Lactarius hengduanensis]